MRGPPCLDSRAHAIADADPVVVATLEGGGSTERLIASARPLTALQTLAIGIPCGFAFDAKMNCRH